MITCPLITVTGRPSVAQPQLRAGYVGASRPWPAFVSVSVVLMLAPQTQPQW